MCASSPEGTESNSADLNKPQHKISTAAVLPQHWEASPPNIFLTGNVMGPEIHPAVLYCAAVFNRKGKEQNSPLLCSWVIVQCLGGRAHNIPFIHPPQLKPVPGVICAMQGGAVWKQLWDMVGCTRIRVSFPGITTSCAVHAREPWTKPTEANSQVFSGTQFTHNIKRAIDWEHILLHYFSCVLQQSWLIIHPGEKEGKKME